MLVMNIANKSFKRSLKI